MSAIPPSAATLARLERASGSLATQAVAVLVGRGDPGAEALLTRLRGTGDTYAEVQLDLCEIDLRLAQRQFDRALAVAAACTGKVATHGWGMERLLLAARHAAVHAEIAVAANAGARPGNAATAARMSWRSLSGTPAAGSSSSSTRGLAAMATAISSSRCLP